MDTRKLEMLLAVVRSGSFSAAAAELGYAQPSVTWNMDRLEADLGVRLLARGRRGVTLTPEGEALLPSVKRIVAAQDELEARAGEIARGLRALVRVGALSSVANGWLPQVIRDYGQRNPSVSFEINVASDSLRLMLDGGRIDLAFCDKARGEGFSWRPLWDDPLYVVMPVDRARGRSVVRLSELEGEALLVAPFDRIDDVVRGAGTGRTIVNCEDSRTMLNMVARGLGASVMTRSNLTDVPAGVAALPLDPPRVRTIGVALARNASVAARAFAEFAAS